MAALNKPRRGYHVRGGYISLQGGWLMQSRLWPAAGVLVAGLIIGCNAGGISDTPMETTGPNQVVIKVPGMT